MAKAKSGGLILASEGVTAIMKEVARPADVSARKNIAARFYSDFVKRFKESTMYTFINPVRVRASEYGETVPEMEVQITFLM